MDIDREQEASTAQPANAQPTQPLVPRAPATVVQGPLPGSKYVRLRRRRQRGLLRRVSAARWAATLAAERPPSRLGRALGRVRHALFGMPIPSERELHERLGKAKALAVFASDNLSSAAYSTDEILLVLMLAGSGHLGLAVPIALSIAALLVVVVFSYRQTVRAYPQGGGAYSVAKDNIGELPALVAAAALLTDYVLTVSVSVSAGVLALVSAAPGLAPLQVELALVALIVIGLVNLRGVRESGTVFAVPTYLFVLAFSSLIVVGIARLALGSVPGSLWSSAAPPSAVPVLQSLTLLLVLRAFASGATALTGTEAIANGVMAFKPPESHNASITLVWMGCFLGAFFVGATFLATRLGVVPVADQSVVSQVGTIIFGGHTPPYYFLQVTTALVLVLAANTAFNDFPRLSSILAHDGYMPRQFAYRGDRLAFSHGIVVLTAISGLLLVVFRADTHRLIPLYAVGVFVAFTISQGGMVLHWRRLGGRGWRGSAVANGIGATATAVVAVIVAAAKFMHGAWIVLVLIPAFVWLLHAIHAHYTHVAALLALPDGEPVQLEPRAAGLPADPMVVPVRSLNLVTARAVEYARRRSSRVTAVHVARDIGADGTFEQRWRAAVPDVPVVVIESPYRSFAGPFRAYLESVQLRAGETLTVVVPDYRPPHWWQGFLHNRTSDEIERVAALRPGVTVVRATLRLRGLTQGLGPSSG